jgi:hypothetical protein
VPPNHQVLSGFWSFIFIDETCTNFFKEYSRRFLNSRVSCIYMIGKLGKSYDSGGLLMPSLGMMDFSKWSNEQRLCHCGSGRRRCSITAGIV